jgi:hypothetical protein
MVSNVAVTHDVEAKVEVAYANETYVDEAMAEEMNCDVPLFAVERSWLAMLMM